MAGTLLGRECRQPVYQNRLRRARSIEELPRSSRLRVSGCAAPPTNPQAGNRQRFENWKRVRAPLRPYCLRSFMRPSREKEPEARRFLAMPQPGASPPPVAAAITVLMALATPWQTAPG